MQISNGDEEAMKLALATKVFQKFSLFIFIIYCDLRVLFQLHLMWRMTFLNTKEESSGVIVARGRWTMVCWLWAMGKKMVNPNR